MTKFEQFPPLLLVRAISLWLQGRIHFSPDQAETVIKGDEEFMAFRKVTVISHRNDTRIPGALFKISFRFARFSSRTNRLLSLIPIPAIIAQPGFICKTWLIGKNSGAFLGIYEWTSVEAAENYLHSFPLRLMKGRAIPDTIDYEIIDLKNSSAN